MVDTSALMAISLGEPRAGRCAEVLAAESEALIAAPTTSECLVVAMGRGVEPEMRRLLDELGLFVVPSTEDRARSAAEAYRRWGKGFHSKATLNICNSFAYALAREFDCPLLYVGNDFAQTDILSAFDHGAED
ncbi:type II toxin-antitoxin system VapC family toxin [Sphingomonas sp.]|uniref:type II toxin-antitoxin system VapC family toxin n=1 Tax=Sphingomonas sp. TaxID=28214 RepID=UPI0035C8645D